MLWQLRCPCVVGTFQLMVICASAAMSVSHRWLNHHQHKPGCIVSNDTHYFTGFSTEENIRYACHIVCFYHVRFISGQSMLFSMESINQKAPWLSPVHAMLHWAICLFLLHRSICRNKFSELRCPRILIWICFNTYGRVAYIWLFGHRRLSPRDLVFLEDNVFHFSTVLTRIPSTPCWIQGPTLVFDSTGLTLQFVARFRCRWGHSCIYISRWKQRW